VREARRLGLNGWVKNLSDGAVETVAEGTQQALKTFVEFLQQGPPAAHVQQLDYDWEPPTGKFHDFEIRH